MTREPVSDKRPQSKVCTGCRKEKPQADFYDKRRSKANKDGTRHHWISLYSKCKGCTDKSNREAKSKYTDWYAEYRKKNKEKISERTKAHYFSAKQEWWRLVSTMMDLSCADCGYSEHTAAFDFHHEEGKDFSIHSAFKSRPTPERWDVVVREIRKCSLLCANCHRVRHAKYNFMPNEKVMQQAKK